MLDREISVNIGMLVLIIYGTSLHELAHAFVAHWLGDPTPGRDGRLTFNPLPHLTPFETAVILPTIGIIVGFGPMSMAYCPINPSRFRKPLRDHALVALAGPLMSFAYACFLVAMIWIAYKLVPGEPIENLLIRILYWASLWELILAVFNLIPIPPLDGYWICRTVLPLRARMTTDGLARNTMIGFVLVFFVGNALLRLMLPYIFELHRMMLPPL